MFADNRKIIGIFLIILGIYLVYNGTSKLMKEFSKRRVGIEDAKKEKQVINEKTLRQKPVFRLYIFYSPECDYCKTFIPETIKVKKQLDNFPEILVEHIDVTQPENDNIAFYYNVETVPNTIFITPEKNVQYIGERSAAGLYEFVVKQIKEYSDKY